jgi:NADH-quinone oxidoreductase subunit H
MLPTKIFEKTNLIIFYYFFDIDIIVFFYWINWTSLWLTLTIVNFDINFFIKEISIKNMVIWLLVFLILPLYLIFYFGEIQERKKISFTLNSKFPKGLSNYFFLLYQERPIFQIITYRFFRNIPLRNFDHYRFIIFNIRKIILEYFLIFFSFFIILSFFYKYLDIIFAFIAQYPKVSNMLIILSNIVGLLIAVAFYTLAERKIMASIQRRKGPDVVGYLGFLQPLADGLKLIIKEIIIPKIANRLLFILAPLFTFFMSLLSWSVIPWNNITYLTNPNLSILFIFALSSFSVYGIMLAGWASNSKYAFLGCMRSTAQMISYEVVIGFILLMIGMFSGSFNLKQIVLMQTSIWFIFPLFPLFIMFFISILAETNRIPFDLPEAEAELVAGYNTEYSSIIFAMFFLAEYSNMLLMSILLVIFFLGGWTSPFIFSLINIISPNIWLCFKTSIIAILFIIIRATFPRVRYDQLMDLCWKQFLPLTLGLFFFYTSLLYCFKAFPVSKNINYSQNINIYFLKNYSNYGYLLPDLFTNIINNSTNIFIN